MAKKVNNAARHAHPNVTGGANQARIAVSRPSLSRKPVIAPTEPAHEDDDIELDDDDVAGEGDDDSMTEMLAMLQEIQKRKVSKTSARTVAFQKQKAALFADARKRVNKAVQEGGASIEKARTTLFDLRAKEVSQEAALASLKRLWENQDDCVQDLLSNFVGIIEDLAHRRAEQINEASAMLEAHVAERESSRRRVLAQARACIEENLENQKIATDADHLIKHYKALLRP